MKKYGKAVFGEIQDYVFIINCLPQTIGLKVPFKALEIVSDMGLAWGLADGSLPITKANSLF